MSGKRVLFVATQLVLLGAAFAGACGGDGPTTPGVRAGIFAIAGANVTDTAGASLLQALIVEVYSARGVRAPEGTVVRFNSVGDVFEPEVTIGPLTWFALSTLVTDSLDANGRASILVRMGLKAGPARIAVSVPTLGLVDTVRYTVQPGKAARIVTTPADTLLYFDASYTVTGKVTDAHNNARPDPVSWSVPAGSPVTVSPAGTVRPRAPGRHSIIATSGTVSGTAMVSALPRLRLLAYRYDPPAIVSQDMDGSNLRVLTAPGEQGIGNRPAWIPFTSLAAYSSVTNGVQLLRVVDEATGGLRKTLISAPPATMTHQVEPAASENGQWMYFSARDTRCGNAEDYCLFRSAIDGSSPELLAAGFPSRFAAPSPDGSKVAYMVNGGLRVLDVASGNVSPWTLPALDPRWSPDGSKIAFLSDSKIMLINPDGTGLRELTPPGDYNEHPGWSPDSKFIVTRKAFGGYVVLIDVASGATIQLPKTETLQTPQVR